MDEHRLPARATLVSTLDEKYLANSVVYDAMVASVTLLLDGDGLRTPSGQLDREWITRRVESSTWKAPALRQRLRSAPLAITAPSWIPAATLDMSYHVQFHPEALGDTPRDVEYLTGRPAGRLLRDRPLWRILFMELESGEVAMVITWHHVLGDARYATELIELLLNYGPTRSIAEATDDDRRDLGRAPLIAVGELIIAWRAFSAENHAAGRWHAYWAKPMRRRLRRWAARASRPLRNWYISLSGGADRIPRRHVRMIRLDAQAVRDRASVLGGSLTDVTVSATLKAMFDANPGQQTATLLVPVSRRSRTDSGDKRNVVSTALVSVAAGLSLSEIITSVRGQLRSPLRASFAMPIHDYEGYATVVPTSLVPLWFGMAQVRTVIGWPVGDPRDNIAVLACEYQDTFTAAITSHVTTDVEALARSMRTSLSPNAGTA